ncbi:MAG: ppa [Candidatus Peribacteria bacterium]|nr:ppa [Candidatus Peribacteria bacterium]
MNLDKLSIGTPPDEIHVVIEIPEGSSIKYELHKETGLIFVDRFVHTAMFFPFNYGFIPHTMSDDGDPLDVMLISEKPVVPGCVILARPIGMLEMEDESGLDTKILAVPHKKVDPMYAHIEELADLDEATQRKIKHFFSNYKTLEDGKWVKIKNILGREDASKAIMAAVEAGKK